MPSPILTCPSCGQPNPAGKRFCGDCGSALPLTCAVCGAANPVGKRFCGDCGSALSSATDAPPAAQPSAPIAAPATESHAPAVQPPEPSGRQEERRLVTALFCDLVGFTPLSEAIDPEDMRDLQGKYFEAMGEQVQRYGGTLEKYAGDAILALFGTPVAHEDDAERAVRCALGMQDALAGVAEHAYALWQGRPAIRIGVNTGEVVSGTWQASGVQDVAVTGDAVNTAARFQVAAEPGEILVGTETVGLTRRRIRYGPRRDLLLKGKSGSVPAFPALGVREQVGERWEEAERETPLVGRDRELLQILDVWIRAQGGEGGVVTLVGEPGVGKSRLAAEVVARLSPSAARVVRGRCVSYGQQISLWLVADILRGMFDIQESDAPHSIDTKLHAFINTLLSQVEGETQREAIDVFGEVLGLPARDSLVAAAGPQIRRHVLVRSVKRLLGALSSRAPIVLVLEDLQWIDAASEEVLAEVLTDVPGLRLLVLATARPGWSAPWSAWSWPERIALRPLAQQDAVALAGAVLGGITLSAELESYVGERAAGNPFFVEELLRALQETGGIREHEGRMVLVPGAADRLPTTLTEILLSRLDRLEPQVRSVVQVGSVIGKSFAVRLLARVMEREQAMLETPLSALQRAEIAFPRHVPDLEYVFKHVTMRDVAYNTLVQRRRRELHLQTARAIEELYPTEEYVEVIAYHYARTDAPEALEWLERAGDRAAAVYATETAVEHYREALARSSADAAGPSITPRLLEKLGTVLTTAGSYSEALEHLGRAAELYQAQHDIEGAGRVVAVSGMVHRFRGTPEEGISTVQPLIDLVSRSGPSEALALLQLAMSSLQFVLGRYSQQLLHAERAVDAARAIGNNRLLGEAEERRGTALLVGGLPDDVIRVLEEALPLIEAGGDLLVLCRALNNLGYTHFRLGQLAENRRYLQRAAEIAGHAGNPDEQAFILSNLGGETLLVLGEWQAARDILNEALAVLASPDLAGAAGPTLSLGQLALYQGWWEAAEQLLQRALTMAAGVGDRQLTEIGNAVLAELEILRDQPEAAVSRLEPLIAQRDVETAVLYPLALAYFRAGRLDDAESFVQSALDKVRSIRGQVFLPDLLRVQGMVAAARHEWDAAERAFQEGLELARSMPSPYAEARLLHEHALLLAQLGRLQSHDELSQALSLFRRLGARKDIQQVEAVLAR